MRLLVLFLSLLAFEKVQACKCYGPEKMDEKQFTMYDIIVHGRVKAIQERETERIIEVVIIRKYKGHANQEIVFRTEKIEERCGIRPAVGEEWLFFGYQTYRGPTTDACTRSRNLRSAIRSVRKTAKADLRFLRRNARKSRALEKVDTTLPPRFD